MEFCMICSARFGETEDETKARLAEEKRVADEKRIVVVKRVAEDPTKWICEKCRQPNDLIHRICIGCGKERTKSSTLYTPPPAPEPKLIQRPSSPIPTGATKVCEKCKCNYDFKLNSCPECGYRPSAPNSTPKLAQIFKVCEKCKSKYDAKLNSCPECGYRQFT